MRKQSFYSAANIAITFKHTKNATPLRMKIALYFALLSLISPSICILSSLVFAYPLESYPDEPSSFHLPEQIHFLRGDKSCRLPVNRHAGREIELLADFSDCFCIPGSPDDSEPDAVTLHVC